MICNWKQQFDIQRFAEGGALPRAALRAGRLRPPEALPTPGSRAKGPVRAHRARQTRPRRGRTPLPGKRRAT